MAMAMSKTYRSSQYLECVNCRKDIILNWYMRHAQKCIDPANRELFAKAAQCFHDVTTGDNKSKIALVSPDLVSPEIDRLEIMRELGVSRPTLDRYCLILANAGYSFTTGARSRRVLREKDVEALKLMVKLSQSQPFEKAAQNIVNALPSEKPIDGIGFSTPSTKPADEKPPQPAAVDQRITQPTQQDQKLLASFHAAGVVTPVSMPKFNEWVECIVERIEEFGAIVRITEQLAGLIHKTRVRKGVSYGVDLNRYFRVGDIVQAQVVDFTKQKINKLGLSTVNSTLPDYKSPPPEAAAVHAEPMPSPMAEKLAPVKAQLKTGEVKPLIEDKNNLEQIHSFVKDKVGVISPEAASKIEELLTAHGMFKFMFSLASVSKDFNVDMGLIFAREIEKNMSDSL